MRRCWEIYGALVYQAVRFFQNVMTHHRLLLSSSLYSRHELKVFMVHCEMIDELLLVLRVIDYFMIRAVESFVER